MSSPFCRAIYTKVYGCSILPLSAKLQNNLLFWWAGAVFSVLCSSCFFFFSASISWEKKYTFAYEPWLFILMYNSYSMEFLLKVMEVLTFSLHHHSVFLFSRFKPCILWCDFLQSFNEGMIWMKTSLQIFTWKFTILWTSRICHLEKRNQRV